MEVPICIELPHLNEDSSYTMLLAQKTGISIKYDYSSACVLICFFSLLQVVFSTIIYFDSLERFCYRRLVVFI